VLVARAVSTNYLALTLEWFAEFFEKNMPPADAAVVVAALQAARSRFLQGDLQSSAPRSPEPWPQAAAMEAALLAGSQRDALALVIQCMDAGRSLTEVEVHVLQPALYRIGEKWQTNQVSVAQEHMATAIAQSVMTIGLLRSPPSAPVHKRVLLACVEGNSHELGLHMVGDAFQLAGWDLQYLGASVPTDDLVRQVVQWKPDLVGLSVSFPQQLRGVRAVMAQLTERLGSRRPAVMVGGLAVNQFDQLTSSLGADASGTDALAAVSRANLLLADQASP
jgi:methanogenic corrinoid protein MtbC1